MSDMVGNTTINWTGAKDIPLKSTENEKVTGSICFTAKMKQFVVFEGVKREAAALSKEIKHRCVIKRLYKLKADVRVFEKSYKILHQKRL